MILLLLACDIQVPCNPALESCLAAPGENPYTGDLTIERASVGCCGPGDEDPACGTFGSWWISLTLSGHVELAHLDIAQAGPAGALDWQEAHQVPIVERDPDGWWEVRYRELQVANVEGCRPLSACADRYRPNRTTLFSCEDRSQLSWTFTLYAEREEDPTLCGHLGAGADPDCPDLEP